MNLKEEIEKIVYSGNEPEIIVDRLVLLIEGNFEVDSKGKASLKQAAMKDVEKWIDEWLDIFPVGIKSGGKLVRSDRAACLKKMTDLVLTSKYYKDEIIEATKEYVNTFKQNDYTYMKCATYFISKKDEGSELIAMCDKRRSGKVKEVITGISDKDDYFV